MKRFIFLFLFLAHLGAKAQFSASSFANPQNITVGSGASNPAGLNSADLDGDGKKDIVSTNHGSTNISILRNTSTPGNISFAPKIDSSGFTAITNAILGDLNKDNKPEIMVCHYTTSALKIFLNQSTPGSIFFPGSISLSVPAGTPANGVIEDFNRDGYNDIAICNMANLGMSVFANTTSVVGATPTFASPLIFSATSSASSPGPRYMVAAHLDNDTLIDIVIINYSNQPVAVFKNTSTIFNISFAAPIYLPSVNLATGADVKDLDGDGKAEIVVGNANNGNFIRIYKNNTTGGTLSFANPFTLSFSNLYELKMADFDGDNKLDIIATNQSGNSIGIYRNIYAGGTLSASSFASMVTYTGVNNPTNVNAEDYDLDGKLDFANANYGSASVGIRRNTHLFPSPTTTATNFTATPTSFGTVQLNWTKGNGSKRIIVAQPTSFNNTFPQDGKGYIPGSLYGAGDTVAPSGFVVYNDSGSTCTVTGLTPGFAYNFALFEYNGEGIYTNYLTSPYAQVTSPILVRYFYAKATGRLDSTGTWGTNTDGTGHSPISFNDGNNYYVVSNNTNPTILANWFITGSNTAIIVNAGYNLNIPSGLVFGADSVAVLANGTLTLNGNLFTNKAYFDTLSNVQFTSTSPQNIPGFNYFNVVCFGSAKTLSGPITVRNNFTSLAMVIGNSNTLTLGNSTHTRTILNMGTNLFQGRIVRWIGPTSLSTTLPYPIGFNGLNYTATLTLSGNVSGTGTISVEFITGNPGNGGLPLFDFSTSPVVQINKTAQNGVWRIESGNGLNMGAVTYTLAVTGTGFFGVNNFAELRLVRRPLSGSWQLSGNAGTNTGSNAAPTVLRTGINNFGEFAIAGDISVNPLPVKLLYFKGKVDGHSHELNWQTSSEQNSSRFEIEQLVQGEWLQLGQVKAAGNSHTISTYQFVSYRAPLRATYRLKMIDQDETFECSPWITLSMEEEETALDGYPNPSNGLVYFTNTSITEINVTDILGKTQTLMVQRGKADLSHLPKGYYILRYHNQTQKLLIQ